MIYSCGTLCRLFNTLPRLGDSGNCLLKVVRKRRQLSMFCPSSIRIGQWLRLHKQAKILHIFIVLLLCVTRHGQSLVLTGDNLANRVHSIVGEFNDRAVFWNSFDLCFTLDDTCMAVTELNQDVQIVFLAPLNSVLESISIRTGVWGGCTDPDSPFSIVMSNGTSAFEMSQGVEVTPSVLPGFVPNTVPLQQTIATHLSISLAGDQCFVIMEIYNLYYQLITPAPTASPTTAMPSDQPTNAPTTIASSPAGGTTTTEGKGGTSNAPTTTVALPTTTTASTTTLPSTTAGPTSAMPSYAASQACRQEMGSADGKDTYMKVAIDPIDGKACVAYRFAEPDSMNSHVMVKCALDVGGTSWHAAVNVSAAAGAYNASGQWNVALAFVDARPCVAYVEVPTEQVRVTCAINPDYTQWTSPTTIPTDDAGGTHNVQHLHLLVVGTTVKQLAVLYRRYPAYHIVLRDTSHVWSSAPVSVYTWTNGGRMSATVINGRAAFISGGSTIASQSFAIADDVSGSTWTVTQMPVPRAGFNFMQAVCNVDGLAFVVGNPDDQTKVPVVLSALDEGGTQWGPEFAFEGSINPGYYYWSCVQLSTGNVAVFYNDASSLMARIFVNSGSKASPIWSNSDTVVVDVKRASGGFDTAIMDGRPVAVYARAKQVPGPIWFYYTRFTSATSADGVIWPKQVSYADICLDIPGGTPTATTLMTTTSVTVGTTDASGNTDAPLTTPVSGTTDAQGNTDPPPTTPVAGTTDAQGNTGPPPAGTTNAQGNTDPPLSSPEETLMPQPSTVTGDATEAQQSEPIASSIDPAMLAAIGGMAALILCLACLALCVLAKRKQGRQGHDVAVAVTSMRSVKSSRSLAASTTGGGVSSGGSGGGGGGVAKSPRRAALTKLGGGSADGGGRSKRQSRRQSRVLQSSLVNHYGAAPVKGQHLRPRVRSDVDDADELDAGGDIYTAPIVPTESNYEAGPAVMPAPSGSIYGSAPELHRPPVVHAYAAAPEISGVDVVGTHRCGEAPSSDGGYQELSGNGDGYQQLTVNGDGYQLLGMRASNASGCSGSRGGALSPRRRATRSRQASRRQLAPH